MAARQRGKISPYFGNTRAILTGLAGWATTNAGYSKKEPLRHENFRPNKKAFPGGKALINISDIEIRKALSAGR